MRKNKNKNKNRKRAGSSNVQYDNFHAQVLHKIKNGDKPKTAIYSENPSHLHELITHYGNEGERHPIVRVAQDAIDRIMNGPAQPPLSHKDHSPFNPYEVGMAALLFTAATDAVWAYLSHAGLGVNGEKTDDFWEQTAAQQLYTSITAAVIMPLVMLAIAKKYNKDLKEAAKIAANVAVATVISVIPFNVFVKYGPELLKYLGVNELLADSLAFLFPGSIEGLLQASSLVIGNLILHKHYIFDKIEYAFAISPLSWFAVGWQGMYQLTSGSSVAEPYRTGMVTTLVPLADTLALYASILMINAATGHVKAKHLDAIAENPKIITDHPLIREHNRAVDITRQVAIPMPSGIVSMLQRFGGGPLHHNQQATGQQSVIGNMRDTASNIVTSGYNYVRSKLFG